MDFWKAAKDPGAQKVIWPFTEDDPQNLWKYFDENSTHIIRILFAPEQQAQPRSQTPASDLLGASEGSDLGQQHAFQTHESASGDPLIAPLDLLHSGPTSGNSTISSGSGHLEIVKLDTDGHLGAFMNAPSARAEGSVDESTGPGGNTLNLFNHLERQAKLHKQAAAVNEATCTWEGCLPPRHYKDPVYSCKVFLGGLPWYITEARLLDTFSVFGPLKVYWPGKNDKWPHCPRKGYVYLLFDEEKSVKMLLEACSQHRLQSDDNLEFYYTLSSRQIHEKKVQVIPWVISDNNFIHCPSQHVCHSNTVFVGALQRTLNAEGLAKIMEDLFGRVVYSGFDTDQYKYPTGSGRVIFADQSSYMKAVTAAIVQIKTCKITRKIQIDPYLHYSVCQICNDLPGLFFCRAEVCSKYYCKSCWYLQHSLDMFSSHQPIMRNRKGPNIRTTFAADVGKSPE